MEWFKLLFLYVLFLTGFFCYGDSFSYEIDARQILENPYNYPNGKALYYMVSGQQWDELPDEVKTDFFQINPEQLKAVLSTYGLLNKQDVVGHYIGSLKRAKTGEIFKKVRTLDEIYTPNIRVANPALYEGVYNKDKFTALIVSPNIETTRFPVWLLIMEGMKWPTIMFIKKHIPI